MNEQEVKSRILKIFNLERKKLTSNFDESHFMDFLTEPAHQKNMIKNSFRGARKYYRFMDKLEIEFGICFSFADLDKYYSVEKLTKKVIERIDKGKGNNMILQKRNEEKNRYFIEIILLLILIGLFVSQGFNWISILATFLVVLVTFWLLSNKLYNKRHNKKMNKRLKEKIKQN